MARSPKAATPTEQEGARVEQNVPSKNARGSWRLKRERRRSARQLESVAKAANALLEVVRQARLEDKRRRRRARMRRRTYETATRIDFSSLTGCLGVRPIPDGMDHGMGAAAAAVEPPALIDADEAAPLMNIKKVNTLYQRVQRGQIPERCIHRTGTRVQFHRARLLAWLDGNKR